MIEKFNIRQSLSIIMDQCCAEFFLKKYCTYMHNVILMFGPFSYHSNIYNNYVFVLFQSFMHYCSMIFLSCWRNMMKNSTFAAIQQRLFLVIRRSAALSSDFMQECLLRHAARDRR